MLKVLLAFSFQLSALSFISASCYPAWAESEAPKLTIGAQKAVYEAQQYMEKKEYMKAEENLKKFIEKNPQKPHYLMEFTLANALAMAGKNRAALDHYSVAANLYPSFAGVWQNMGKIYFDLKQYDEAGDCLVKGYEHSEKKAPSLLYYAAVSYIMAEKGEKAMPHLQRLASGELGPPKTEWLEAFLKVCMDLQFKEEAFEAIHGLIARNGRAPRWWKILAQFHLQQSEYEEAVAALTVYSYLTSPKKQDIILLGDLYNAVGVPLKAAEYYEKALGLENKPTDYEKLASAYMAAHKTAKAMDALDRALEETPTSALWFLKAQLLYEQESFSRAYEAFSQSACLDPRDGQALLLMGYCAYRVDKKDKAEAALQKAAGFPKQRKMATGLLKRISLVSRQ